MPSGTPRRHVLVLEPDGRGHGEEWLLHIVRFLRDEAPDVSVSMLVSPDLATRLIEEPGAQDLLHLRILPLGLRELRLCLHPNLSLSAFARWWVMRRYLARTGAAEGIFMCVDALSLPFALGLGLDGCKASGILFRPSVHYASLGQTNPSLKERIRDWRKGALYPSMLRNRAVDIIHSLDPYFPSYARDRYVWGHKVAELADPVNDPGRTTAGKSPFPDDRVGFLLFGELTGRKGILELLAACEHFDARTARRAAILLAGRVEAPLRDKVKDALARIRARHPGLWIELDDRRLTFEELSTAVETCDVVLAPYQRFVGSSGVLIWAAQTGKPVITQAYGLVARLTRDFGLGLTADTASPEALADAITLAVTRGPASLIDKARAKTFLAAREGRLFAARLLGVSVTTRRNPEADCGGNLVLKSAAYETQGGHTTASPTRGIVING